MEARRVLGNTYSVPLSLVSNVESHTRALTMTPKEMGGFSKPESFDVYSISDDCLHVPRFYGLHHFGPPDVETLTPGVQMQPDLAFSGKLNEGQEEAASAVLAELGRRKGALLVRKPGGGKTVLSIYIALTLRVRTVIFCHTSALMDQWEDRIGTFAPGASVGRIQQNKVNVDVDFVVAMLQSVASRDYDPVIFEGFGFGIVDETHHMGARQFFTVLSKIRPQYLMGVTATPDRRDGLTCLLYYGLGDVAHRDKGDDVEQVNVTVLKYTGGNQREVKIGSNVNMPLMVNKLAEDEVRTRLIVEQIKKLYDDSRRIIVLAHVRKLLDLICEGLQRVGVKDDAIAFFVGGMKPKDRSIAITRQIILATYSMAKEGFDVKELDAEVLATPLGDVEQAVGRIQRPCVGKPAPILLDIYDPFSIFMHTGRKRRRFYESKGFCVQEKLLA